MAFPVKIASPGPVLSQPYDDPPDAPTPPSSPRFAPPQEVAQRSFRCMAFTFGAASVAALLGGGYCFFSPLVGESNDSENYSQQVLGITLLALGTLGCFATGCLAQHKSYAVPVHDDPDDEGILL